jgi:deoxycytidine triphosphate deaminase
MHPREELAVVTSREIREGGLPELVTGARLRDAIEQATFVKDGTPDSVVGVKYDLHIGNRILKATYSQPVDIDKLSESDRGNLRVDPGEVVFVLTRETLDLPKNMMAVLSPKRTLAHSGIMLLGGLMVDPNYSGVLWVGLYNFSSNGFPLRPGKKLISAMFYELMAEEAQDFPVLKGETDFPDSLIDLIKHYKPIEIKGLQDEIIHVKAQIASLRTELITDKDWKEEFKISLAQHNDQLGKLIDGLEQEKAAREKEDEKIKSKLETILNFAGAAKILWGFALLVIAALLGYFVPKWLG